MRYYLAYGSNLNKEQMLWRCPTAEAVGTTILEGWELKFRGSMTGAYLTIEESEGGMVPVAIWSVTRHDEAALDRYEGYPSFYYKRPFTVEYGGQTLEAFAYIMHEDRPLGVPSLHYVQVCNKGYDDFGFDPTILFDAYRKSRKEAV